MAERKPLRVWTPSASAVADPSMSAVVEERRRKSWFVAATKLRNIGG